MRWEKLGKIFSSSGQRPWMATHAAVPTPELIRDHLYRIYFSPRDEQGRSHVAWLTIDIREPTRVLELCERPCLSPGALGAFDDRGTMFCWIVTREGRRWLYYVGWNAGGQTPWRTGIGLAYADANDPNPIFERHAQGPILDRSPTDPFLVAAPFVIPDQGRWRMWYISGVRWEDASPRPLPRFNVRHAESPDGIRWTPTGQVCVDYRYDGEVAIGRPFVLKERDIYRMFFSFRGDTFGYRMGYAESADGLAWTRRDETLTFDGPVSDWDNEAMAYPTVFDHEGVRYMLYVGNGYSKSGFGIAALAD